MNDKLDSTGRASKAARQLKQVTIGLRVPAELRRQLESAATGQHRNLSQEAERRLAHSFEPGAMFVDALNALGPHRNPLGAAAHVRTLLHAVYGPEVGDLGQTLMTGLALLRFAGGNGPRVTLRKGELDALKAAIRELEKAADPKHAKD
jgi:hypothetical protein